MILWVRVHFVCHGWQTRSVECWALEALAFVLEVLDEIKDGAAPKRVALKVQAHRARTHIGSHGYVRAHHVHTLAHIHTRASTKAPSTMQTRSARPRMQTTIHTQTHTFTYTHAHQHAPNAPSQPTHQTQAVIAWPFACALHRRTERALLPHDATLRCRSPPPRSCGSRSTKPACWTPVWRRLGTTTLP